MLGVTGGPYQRGDISRPEHAHVPLDYRAYLRIVRLDDLARVVHVREGCAGPLQSAVDSRNRGPKLRGDLGADWSTSRSSYTVYLNRWWCCR